MIISGFTSAYEKDTYCIEFPSQDIRFLVLVWFKINFTRCREKNRNPNRRRRTILLPIPKIPVAIPRRQEESARIDCSEGGGLTWERVFPTLIRMPAHPRNTIIRARVGEARRHGHGGECDE